MSSNQLITNEEALRLFFNDDVYLIGEGTSARESAELKLEMDKIALTKENVAQAKASQVQSVATLPQVTETNAAHKTVFDFKYLGKNERSILILVNDRNNPVSTPQGTELLRKLVLSINLKNADFALLNYANYPAAKFVDLSSFFGCKLVLSFGISPADLGLADQQLHQLHSVENIQMIFTHNLHDLEADLSAKKALWGTLKNLKLEG